MRPMPLRTSVGAICETIPPAPMHNTPLLEKIAWSNPGIFCWRSSAPAMALPRSLSEVCETVDAGCMVFHSFPVDFEFQVLVQAHEADEPVAAEDGHHRHVTCALQPFLEPVVDAGGTGSVGAVAGVAVEVGQEFVAELFELDEQVVRGGHVRHDAHRAAPLMRKLGPLIQDQHAFHFRSGDEEE